MLCLFSGIVAHAQVAVTLMPVPQLQFFDQNGTPLAFGCVFTYRSQTTTPLNTYTDFTGTILNSNPVPLNAAGSAGIWLQSGQAYTITVKSAGGDPTCSLGTQIESVDGIGGGLAQAVTPITPSPTPSFVVTSQIQVFTLILTADTVALPVSFVGVSAPVLITFQITQDGTGSHAYTCPANVLGCTAVDPVANHTTSQTFVWNGTTILPVGSGFTSSNDVLFPGNVISTNNYTGANTFSGNDTFSGTNSFTGANTFSNAANVFKGASYTSGTANPALTGILRLADTDSVCWRDHAHLNDLCISKDTGDDFQMPNLGLSGVVTKVGGFSTLELGVPAILGEVIATGRTADLSATPLIASAPQSTLYRVSCYEIVTTAAGSSSTLPDCVVTWTSAANNTVQTKQIAATSSTNSLTALTQGSAVIDAKFATSIDIATTSYASNPATTMVYDIQAIAEAF